MKGFAPRYTPILLFALVASGCWADIHPAPADPEAIIESGEDEVRDPGRVTIHRLNRAEYNNTVRDLFLTDLRPADDFPADDLGYGFDNIADVLSISPLHIELYERAAQQLVEEALLVLRPALHHFEAEEAHANAGAVFREITWNLWNNGELFNSAELEVAGVYRFSAFVSATQGGDELAQMALLVDHTTVGTVDVESNLPDFELHTVEVELEAGRHTFSVGFLNDYYDPETSEDRNLIVDWFAVEGPLDADYSTPQRDRIMLCQPDADDHRPCARQILETFGRRALRRPLTAVESDRFVALVDLAVDGGGTFDDGMGLVLQSVVLSPSFLFRPEIDADPESPDSRPLNDFELASRMSYFIWSSMPDDELLDAAAEGLLQDPAEVEAQTRRMLRDPRSVALVDNFAGQWLYVRDIPNAFPDIGRFPEFDEALRDAMRSEMLLFFESFIAEGRDMRELLASDTTFVNERLAQHYGLPGVTGAEFAEVAVGAAPRGGLLTQAGLMMVLSTPLRTSVVRRGKWVLSQLLCSEPAAPPPGVEGLPEDEDAVIVGTLRERMELHRSDPTCAACHEVMDAIGFGLENYDGIGLWRVEEAGDTIDASGSLPGNLAFDGALELSELLAEDDRFFECVAEKAYTYALGRGTTSNDEPYLRDIVRGFRERGNLFEELAVLIVTSEPFRRRRGELPTDRPNQNAGEEQGE